MAVCGCLLHFPAFCCVLLHSAADAPANSPACCLVGCSYRVISPRPTTRHRSYPGIVSANGHARMSPSTRPAHSQNQNFMLPFKCPALWCEITASEPPIISPQRPSNPAQQLRAFPSLIGWRLSAACLLHRHLRSERDWRRIRLSNGDSPPGVDCETACRRIRGCCSPSCLIDWLIRGQRFPKRGGATTDPVWLSAFFHMS